MCSCYKVSEGMSRCDNDTRFHFDEVRFERMNLCLSHLKAHETTFFLRDRLATALVFCGVKLDIGSIKMPTISAMITHPCMMHAAMLPV